MAATTSMSLISIDSRNDFGTGLFLSITTLSSFTAMLALSLAFRELPEWLGPAVVVLFAAVSAFVFFGRAAVADIWITMEPKARLATVGLLGAVYALSSHAPGEQPLTGLAVLHLAMMVFLTSPRGFAWYYMLTGLTAGICLLHLPFEVGIGFAAAFLLLLMLTCAYDNFFFALEANPTASRASAWLPLGLALQRWIFTIVVTAPAAWFLPMPNPFLKREFPRYQPEQVPTKSPEEFNLDLMKMAFYTILLIALILGLLAMLRYLRNKLRRKGPSLVPESIGVPVGTIMKLGRQSKRDGGSPADTPRERIVQLYTRFGQSFRAEKSRRKPAQTPYEYATTLQNRAALSGDQVAEITRSFVDARYSPDEVTWDDTKRFENLTHTVLASEPKED